MTDVEIMTKLLTGSVDKAILDKTVALLVRHSDTRAQLAALADKEKKIHEQLVAHKGLRESIQKNCPHLHLENEFNLMGGDRGTVCKLCGYWEDNGSSSGYDG